MIALYKQPNDDLVERGYAKRIAEQNAYIAVLEAQIDTLTQMVELQKKMITNYEMIFGGEV